MSGTTKTFFFCLIFSLSVYADSWKFSKGVTYKELKLGDITCTVTTIVREESKNNYPSFNTSCIENGNIIFDQANLGAENLSFSPDRRYLVGISNSGFNKYAYWVFDLTRNKMVKSLRNDKAKQDFFCSASVRLKREWYLSTSSKPIIFEKQDDNSTSVKVEKCSIQYIKEAKVQRYTEIFKF